MELKKEAEKELQSIVDEYNELQNQVQTANVRLGELRLKIQEKQGYLSALQDIEKEKAKKNAKS